MVVFSFLSPYVPDCRILIRCDHMLFYKKNRRDKIWWVNSPDKDGGLDFTFDKVKIFSAWQDYPHNLTPEQKAIFDRENPFWADFFKDRK